MCTSTPYQPDKLPGFKKRFTVHLVFSFLDLLILTPITVRAAGALTSIEAKFCGQIDENLVWIQISRILFLYSCSILVLASLFCIAGSGLWYFWLALDLPQNTDNYERVETDDSQGCLTSFGKIKYGNGQTLFNQDDSKTFEQNNLESLLRAKDHSRSFLSKLQEANETELRK